MACQHHDPIVAQRFQQRLLFSILPESMREPLLPDINRSRPTPPPAECAVIERALRNRADELLAQEADLAAYVDRCRRHRYAGIISRLVSDRYIELAADAPEAMSLEQSLAKKALDPEVETPSYETGMLLARLVPLLGWADFFESLAIA